MASFVCKLSGLIALTTLVGARVATVCRAEPTSLVRRDWQASKLCGVDPERYCHECGKAEDGHQRAKWPFSELAEQGLERGTGRHEPERLARVAPEEIFEASIVLLGRLSNLHQSPSTPASRRNFASRLRA